MSDIRTETGTNVVKFTSNTQQDTYNLDNKKNVECSSSQNRLSEVSESVRDCQKSQTIEQGLDFMLWHFQEPLWPRNVSTSATRGAQKVVHDRDGAVLFYQGALRQDCRLACYLNYEELAKMGAITPGYNPKPSHLYIDLDLDTFKGDRHKLDLALKSTLRNIKRDLGKAIPSVFWSGGGYHIHLPLDTAVVPAYEELPEFKRYKDPSVQFMRYAERQITNGRCDLNHCVSFKSCMARVPASINSKYTGDTAEVRIIQAWDGVRAKPTQQFMLTDFLIWLVQADFDAREKLRKQAQRSFFPISSSLDENNTGIGWIDRLLQIAVPDWRKTAVALILAPYLLTIKRLSYEQAYNTIMQWAARCGQLSSLRPNDRAFVDRVHMALQRAQDKGQRPMKWATLIRDYSAMYETFKQAV